MNTAAIVEASYRALLLVLFLSLPAVITSAAIGLLTSIVQAVTQIQDQGLGQALKLITVLVALVTCGSWMASELYHSADHLLTLVGFGGADAS